MKTLRVFISSTFDDFYLERNALQYEVFPYIENLCLVHGINFMPIDLRWGVTTQVQFNQKTMELCLDEVVACKDDPHPDFILLLGDRYGWIPLPYCIEQKEFELIITNIKDFEDIKFLTHWYKLDKNQLPSSYILEKINSELNNDTWNQIEKRLRNILQSGANEMIDNTSKSKYFSSATEQEFDQYMFNMDDIKKQSIFVIERQIDNKTKYPDAKKYFDDNPQLNKFKEHVQKTVLPKNYCKLYTSLENPITLSNNHILNMVESTKRYLENAIIREIEKLNDIKVNREKELQGLYKRKMTHFTVGREIDIERIIQYTKKNVPSQPLIIYGASGIGKSTIIANVIKKSEKDTTKILYRFCGISGKLSNTRSLWISIFSELSIKLSSHTTKQTKNDLLSLDINDDAFETEVHDILYNLKEKVIIYIDALDQLDDKSKCHWLPCMLPANIKIVISVLKDSNFEDSSYYFYKLRERISNFYEILPLDNPNLVKDILLNILKEKNRTLQDFQIDMILQLYIKIGTPLYLKIIAEEVKNYNATEQIFLPNTQNGAITQFIENLYTRYHHEYQLVQKVFGYITSSQFSLSESMLYNILSNDDKLMKSVGFNYIGEKHHKLPPIVWARLHHQISPFLVNDSSGNIKFFHREFSHVAKKMCTVEILQNLLSILQKMIDETFVTKNQIKLEEISKIYILTLANLIYLFPTYPITHYINFIVSKNDYEDEWIKNILLNISEYIVLGNIKTIRKHCYTALNLILSDNLYAKDSKKWYFTFAEALIAEANILKMSNDYIKSVEYYQAALFILENNNNLSYEMNFLLSLALNNLSNIRFEFNEIEEAIQLQMKNLELQTRYYNENQERSFSGYMTSLINFGNLCLKYGKYDEAYNINAQISSLAEKHQMSPELKISMFELFSNTYKINHDYENALILDQEILNLTKSLYESNQERFIRQYLDAQQNLAKLHFKLENFQEAYDLQTKVIPLITRQYEKDSMFWKQDYMVALNQYSIFSYHLNYIDMAIEIQKTAIKILEDLCQKDNRFYIKYLSAFEQMSFLYEENKDFIEAKKYSDKVSEIKHLSTILKSNSQ